MRIESNINKYYWYNFLKVFSFWLPVFTIYFLVSGLNYTQILILAVAQAVFQIIFEVPSGVFADYYGRKTCLIIASILKLSCYSLLYFGNSFSPFLIASSIFGVSMAFKSGSDSAFIYDTLRDLKREKEYKKVEGKAFSYMSAGWAFGALFGGFIADINIKLCLLLTIIPLLAATILSFFFVEPKHHKRSDDRNYFKHLKDAAIFSFNHKRVKWLIVFSGLMAGIMLISHRFFQPYMQASNIDIAYFGVIYFFLLGFCSIAARIAYRIERNIGEFWSLMIIPLLLGAHLILMGKYVFALGILFALAGEFTWGFTRPVVTDYINRHVESHHRATVMSLSGFFQAIVLIIFSPLFGYIADVFAFTTALFFEGIIVLVLGVPLVFILKNSNSIIKNSTPG